MSAKWERYDKLMALANDRAATPAEAALARERADALKAKLSPPGAGGVKIIDDPHPTGGIWYMPGVTDWMDAVAKAKARSDGVWKRVAEETLRAKSRQGWIETREARHFKVILRESEMHRMHRLFGQALQNGSLLRFHTSRYVACGKLGEKMVLYNPTIPGAIEILWTIEPEREDVPMAYDPRLDQADTLHKSIVDLIEELL